VGEFYENFDQVDDSQVRELLKEANKVSNKN
jgi:predicted phosphoribosyltransferase